MPTRCPGSRGFAGLGWNKELLKAATGKAEMKTLDDLWNPALKGKITVLDEMRDTIGIIMMAQGKDPSNFTEDDFNAAADELQKQLDSGQIRQVTGNDYLDRAREQGRRRGHRLVRRRRGPRRGVRLRAARSPAAPCGPTTC